MTLSLKQNKDSFLGLLNGWDERDKFNQTHLHDTQNKEQVK